MTIIPRWEWRTFGASFGAAEERLAASEAGKVEESDEVYLLSLRSDASVKLRGGVLDAKRLLQTDGTLEQWMPVFKAGLPLSSADAAALLELLGVQDLATLDLRETAVRKRRAHYTIGGCMAELTELRTKEGRTRTIAVEATDPALVRAAVRELGLEHAHAMCVARGLKALVGWGARRAAVIDVGTNSVKFHLAEESTEGWTPLVDRSEVTRLGEGLEATGELGDAPVARTADAVAGMVAEAREHGAATIVAVGTAGLRSASNRAKLIDAVRQRCGLEVAVISGDEEARLAYLGAMSGLQLDGTVAVFDSGGGSSQFTFGDERFSVDVGAVRVTERFGLDRGISAEVVAKARAALEHELARLRDQPRPDAVVGMGGAVTNLAAVSLQLSPYDPDRVQGTTLDRAEIERQIELYRTRDAAERRAIVGLQPARAEVILGGACIVRTVLELLDAEALTVSDRGLRHGVLIERA
jgi:exopolyphosphatase / guanosine-5'-triphosphate,3'-diphosphate pyrophosphatase